MSDSSQWYGSVTYSDETNASIAAGLSQMERWNTPGNDLFAIVGGEDVMKNLSHIIATNLQAARNRLWLNGERILAASEVECPVDMTYEKRNVIRARISRSRTRTRQYSVPTSLQWFGNAGKVMVKVRGRLKGGYLLSTGTVEATPDDPNAIQIGYKTPYAHRQHEDLTYHHTKPGAKAKYLEDPANRIAPTIAADIVDSLRGYLA